MLDRLRQGWLNPEGASEAELKKRTLTNLYNSPEVSMWDWLVPKGSPSGATNSTIFVATPHRTPSLERLGPTDSGRVPASDITISSSWPATAFNAKLTVS